MLDLLQNRLIKSRMQAEQIILPALRWRYVEIGDCITCEGDVDMIDKVDAQCDGLTEERPIWSIGIRCQGPRYSTFETHTFRRSEVERFFDLKLSVPDFLVHAYLKSETSLRHMGVMTGERVRNIFRGIGWHNIKWRDSEGQPARFTYLNWSEYPHDVEIIKPDYLF